MEAALVETDMVAQEVILEEEIVIGILAEEIVIGTVNLEEDMAKIDKEDSWIEEVEVTREDMITTEVVVTLEDTTITEEVGVVEAITEGFHRRLVTDAVRKVIWHMIAQCQIKENHLTIEMSDQYQHKSIN